MTFGSKCVLVTNGNLPSMLALADWLRLYGHQLEKIYVTYRLPSSKSNVSGALAILRNSGASYLGLKLLLNKVIPLSLKFRGLPYSVESFVEMLGLDIPVEPVGSVKTREFLANLKSFEPRSLVSFSATQRFPVDSAGTETSVFEQGAPLLRQSRLAKVSKCGGLVPESC